MNVKNFSDVLNIGSIKAKLALGFGLVLVLLAFVAWEGRSGLKEASDGFTEYREMARDANLAGRLQGNLLLARMAIMKFMKDGTDASLQQFKERSNAFQGFLNQAQEDIQNPERAALIDDAEKQFTAYNNTFNTVVELLQKEKNILQDVLIANEVKAMEHLSSIMKSARRENNTQATYTSGECMRSLISMRLFAQKYLSSHNNIDVAGVEQEMKVLRMHLKNLNNELTLPADRELVSSFIVAINAYHSGFKDIVATITERNGLYDGVLATVGPKIADEIEKVKLSIMAVQDEIGPRLQSSNEAAVSTIDMTSAIALIFGATIAGLLAFTISRRLGKTVRYAEDITSGKFDTELDITGKDELAVLAGAMRKIPETLTDMSDAFKNVSNDVRTGHLNNRADASRFQGSFAEIVDSTNTMADAFSSYLDLVPMPVMAIDTDYTITYLNKTAQDVGGFQEGSISTNAKCYDVFKTSDCQSENCACNRAMKNLEKAESETDAHPQGLDLEISYSGIPIFDNKGKVAGALEVIVDQTQIKQTQRRILKAVEQATDVSERIASASEELAAQVEQVSQGSQQQSERTAETASAMEQMNSTVLEVARNASKAAQNADLARQRATSGSQVVEKSVNAIGSVKSSADELTENMNGLSKQAESIGDVMTVISDIADQTNLLALNAAIEAARAGDAGRGFAVVADEVRKLAEKTMSATDEVGKSISAIQEAAKRNMGSMDRAVKAINEATELSQESGKALMEIVDFSQTSADQVQSIATASEEQSATSEQISGAVESINQITTETADGMQQSAKAIQELAVMSGELKEVISSLNQA